MKALFYSDWCTLKGLSKSYPLPVLIIVAVATLSGVSNSDNTAGVELASQICVTAISCGIMMLASFGFFGLFGADERDNWDAVRLSLPVTRRMVVRARYVSLLMWVVALTVVINAFGIVLSAIATAILYGAPALPVPTELILLNFAIITIFMVYLGLVIPMCYKLGLSKARIYSTLPFLLCMLFTIEPVQKAARHMIERVNNLIVAMGSPVPLAFAALAVGLVVYVASMAVAQGIYERRDF